MAITVLNTPARVEFEGAIYNAAMTAHGPLTRFGTADLQIHTSHGDGMADAHALFERIETRTDLDVVAVTDHDDVRGALLARDVHARGNYTFEFVPGIEVTTRSGHLLALWVDEPVRSFRPLAETIETVHRMGGMAVIPHPLSYLTRSVGERALDRLLAAGGPEARPDGIEVANTTLAGRVTGARALRANRARWGLAETGGSDAHFPEEVGAARTLFRGRTAAELRSAILAGETRGLNRGAVPLRAIGPRRLALQQVRGLSTTPRKVLGPPLVRAARRARVFARAGAGARQ
jgi:predicted metal-dependent phosphoesterase TrpH